MGFSKLFCDAQMCAGLWFWTGQSTGVKCRITNWHPSHCQSTMPTMFSGWTMLEANQTQGLMVLWISCKHMFMVYKSHTVVSKIFASPYHDAKCLPDLTCHDVIFFHPHWSRFVTNLCHSAQLKLARWHFQPGSGHFLSVKMTASFWGHFALECDNIMQCLPISWAQISVLVSLHFCSSSKSPARE